MVRTCEDPGIGDEGDLLGRDPATAPTGLDHQSEQSGFEREKVIAEDGQVITTPWTFGDVAAGLNKGAFEDLVEDRAKQKRRKFGFTDGERARRWKRQSGEIGGDESHAEEPARKERAASFTRRPRTAEV